MRVGQGVKAGVVRDGDGEGFGLALAQNRRCFDQVHLGGGVKAGNTGGGAQDVGHQGAAPGAGFDQIEGIGRALIHPGLGKGEAQKLAEHLTDFGSGCEVACRAKRIACGVVAVGWMGEAFGHVVRQRDRTRGLNTGLKERREWCHGLRRAWPGAVTRGSPPRAPRAYFSRDEGAIISGSGVRG